MQKHTQEHWFTGEQGSEHHINAKLDGVTVNILSANGDNTNPALDRANAARAVACVNALEGVENPEKWKEIQVERIKENLQLKIELTNIRDSIGADENESTFDEVERLLSQRNNLLLALRKVEQGFKNGNITQEHYDTVAEVTEKYKHIELTK